MIDLATLPDQHGHFGPYGGMFVPETLMTALNELTEEYAKARKDAVFVAVCPLKHANRSVNNEAAAFCAAASKSSPSRTRTCNKPVNSRLLYH